MNKIVVFCGSSVGFNPIYKEAAIALGNYFAENKPTGETSSSPIV